ncbi:uncharacterized protein PHACADRAFT_192499 [Phanerochaete carnosa HHB-10118-sp]|uniref:Uncharacterized protein n=1 Tax=Phanerochaete carnosa (strain HHB-10118-sp) TaxID=650164 RepID=K5XAY2_PHACS|nr:uncharacterized protein PHACADRAFT_192499 [Phanerochaete carnosa HHB-10118-sp]EKM60097.1 hypothetical protein PHACADRAFT_192499 [Phanerochaete carnosa HHB-10118-sp]
MQSLEPPRQSEIPDEPMSDTPIIILTVPVTIGSVWTWTARDGAIGVGDRGAGAKMIGGAVSPASIASGRCRPHASANTSGRSESSAQNGGVVFRFFQSNAHGSVGAQNGGVVFRFFQSNAHGSVGAQNHA